MKICAGQCRYLITLYNLSRENNTVRSVDIANALSVTRPSVSRMLKCMARLGYIDSDYSAGVSLTEEGRTTAERLVSCFDDVYMFFLNILKLDDEAAYEQSIKFIAAFPEHTVERLSEVTRTTIKRKNNRLKINKKNEKVE